MADQQEQQQPQQRKREGFEHAYCDVFEGLVKRLV